MKYVERPSIHRLGNAPPVEAFQVPPRDDTPIPIIAWLESHNIEYMSERDCELRVKGPSDDTDRVATPTEWIVLAENGRVITMGPSKFDGIFAPMGATS